MAHITIEIKGRAEHLEPDEARRILRELQEIMEPPVRPAITSTASYVINPPIIGRIAEPYRNIVIKSDLPGAQ